MKDHLPEICIDIVTPFEFVYWSPTFEDKLPSPFEPVHRPFLLFNKKDVLCLYWFDRMPDARRLAALGDNPVEGIGNNEIRINSKDFADRPGDPEAAARYALFQKYPQQFKKNLTDEHILQIVPIVTEHVPEPRMQFAQQWAVFVDSKKPRF